MVGTYMARFYTCSASEISIARASCLALLLGSVLLLTLVMVGESHLSRSTRERSRPEPIEAEFRTRDW